MQGDHLQGYLTDLGLKSCLLYSLNQTKSAHGSTWKFQQRTSPVTTLHNIHVLIILFFFKLPNLLSLIIFLKFALYLLILYHRCFLHKRLTILTFVFKIIDNLRGQITSSLLYLLSRADKTYDPTGCSILAKVLAEEIKSKVKELNYKRYSTE